MTKTDNRGNAGYAMITQVALETTQVALSKTKMCYNARSGEDRRRSGGQEDGPRVEEWYSAL